MADDKKMNDTVSLINNEAKTFLDYVSYTGNQCAYTDRIIEKIIKLSKLLEKEYQS